MTHQKKTPIGINLPTAEAMRTISSNLEKSATEIRNAVQRLQLIYDEKKLFLGIYEKKVGQLITDLADAKKEVDAFSLRVRENTLKWASDIERLVEENNRTDGKKLSAVSEPVLDMDQIWTSIVSNSKNGRKLIIPQTKGRWSDPASDGDSKFIPFPNETFWYKGKRISYASLFEKYREKRLTGIEYHNQRPDFSDFADVRLGSPYLEEMPEERQGKNGSYRAAAMWVVENLAGFSSISEVNAYMTKHDLVWHEIDLHHVIAIPGDIHAAFRHTGGIGMKKIMKSITEIVYKHIGPNYTLCKIKGFRKSRRNGN